MTYTKTTAASWRAEKRIKYLHISIAVAPPVLNEQGQVVVPEKRTPKGQGRPFVYTVASARVRDMRKLRPGAQRRVAIRLAREMGQDCRP